MDMHLLVKQIDPIVKEGGELLLSYYQKTITKNVKHDGSYATQADIENERFLIERLKPLIPGAGFCAEESGIVEGNDYCWVIDPLDGTTNFAQGLPYFCTSLALTYKDESVIGIVYQPLLQEFFYAIKGGGAFVNGQALSVSDRAELNQTVVVCELPYVDRPDYFQLINSVETLVYTRRTFGAAALDLAYCAAGRIDAVLFRDLSWWDVAAGMLLITEAGGEVSGFKGEKIGPNFETFLGGNKLIIKKISQEIA